MTDGQEAPGADVIRIVLSAYFAAAAAGWMFSGVFGSVLARSLGLVGPAVGAAIVGTSFRFRRPSAVQHMAVPAAFVLGALTVVPDAAGGSANLPHLVLLALRGGGLSQPPVAFDPGWRFLLVLVTVLAGSAFAAVAVARRGPALAALFGAALVAPGALVQPSSAETVSVVGALVLLIASLGVSFGGAAEETGGRAFEVRRLGRGAVVLLVLLVALLGLSRVGFLFPSAAAHQVIPPKRPEAPPPEADRVLFTVQSDRAVTWRLGVLDGYDGHAFLTPPYDTGRFVDVRGRNLPEGPASGPTFRARFTIADVLGHVLPAPPSPVKVVAAGARVTFDPRTQQLRLPSSQARRGMTYSVDAPVPPSAQDLAASPPAPDSVRPFLKIPEPPPAVSDLLGQAPAGPAFARLQYVRNVFYAHVVAAGAGNPVDVPPARVTAMLQGQPASPYEITAGEVLLARWAGIPARIGYGYYGGQAAPDGRVEVRPRNGATWLEAYFDGHGWVPIVGSPPRAQTSLRRTSRRNDPTVRPTDELALVVYVPVRLRTAQLFYAVARYWVGRAVGAAMIVALLLLCVPGIAKAVRRQRRRRWAAGRPPADRLLASYGELRDTATDLGIGRVELTPLELVGTVAHDEEHRQLAWLVTRGLWGDLARDLTAHDAETGEDMAASVAKRLRRAQPGVNRLSAFASRASLRQPWEPGLPNVWPRPAAGRRRAVRSLISLVLIVTVTVGVVATRQGLRPSSARSPGALPARLAPTEIDDIGVQPEPSLDQSYRRAGPASAVATGRVLSIRQGGEIQGSLQVGAFRADLDAGDAEVRRQVLRSIGGGAFRLTRLGVARVYALDLPEQRFLLWFPPSGRYFELMVTRKAFTRADSLFVALLDYQRGGAAKTLENRTGVPVPDPRRGVAE